jgi:N-acetylneuraminate synthase
LTAAPGAFEIAGHRIGEPGSVFVIAELSANHLGDVDRALALVEAAADAGADAIKLQTYTADTMTLDIESRDFRLDSGPWAGRTLYDLYGQACTPWEWHPRLRDAATEAGLVFLSTPFDETAVDFLDELGVPAFKIASFELVDVPLLKAVGRTGKPALLSTGLATMDEVAEAIEVLRDAGCPGMALLHCTSAYPAALEDANLLTIPALQERFGMPVGLSDHTLDPAVPAAAAGLGACILEKHFTLRRDDGGPDAGFSLEPDEFRHAASTARAAARARGVVKDGPTPGEQESRIFRRSLIAVRDIPKGARIEPGWVRSLRPAIGLHPRFLDEVIGRRTSVNIQKGTGLFWDHLEPENGE